MSGGVGLSLDHLIGVELRGAERVAQKSLKAMERSLDATQARGEGLRAVFAEYGEGLVSLCGHCAEIRGPILHVLDSQNFQADDGDSGSDQIVRGAVDPILSSELSRKPEPVPTSGEALCAHLEVGAGVLVQPQHDGCGLDSDFPARRRHQVISQLHAKQPHTLVFEFQIGKDLRDLGCDQTGERNSELFGRQFKDPGMRKTVLEWND